MELIGHPLAKSKKIKAGSSEDFEKPAIPFSKWPTHSIYYDFNKFGFRCPEFDTVNWEESVVVLGCSCTAGVGLAKENTVTSLLSNEIGRPVINLGVAASGIDLACYNSIILHDHFPKPLAVVQLWSDTARYVDMDRERYLHPHLYFPKRHNYDAKYNWDLRSYFYRKTDKSLWAGKTKYYEATFFFETSKLFNCDFVHREDQAIDGLHPGIVTTRKMAHLIAINLKL